MYYIFVLSWAPQPMYGIHMHRILSKDFLKRFFVKPQVRSAILWCLLHGCDIITFMITQDHSTEKSKCLTLNSAEPLHLLINVEHYLIITKKCKCSFQTNITVDWSMEKKNKKQKLYFTCTSCFWNSLAKWLWLEARDKFNIIALREKRRSVLLEQHNI